MFLNILFLSSCIKTTQILLMQIKFTVRSTYNLVYEIFLKTIHEHIMLSNDLLKPQLLLLVPGFLFFLSQPILFLLSQPTFFFNSQPLNSFIISFIVVRVRVRVRVRPLKILHNFKVSIDTICLLNNNKIILLLRGGREGSGSLGGADAYITQQPRALHTFRRAPSRSAGALGGTSACRSQRSPTR
jgi:hypothetical protein